MISLIIEDNPVTGAALKSLLLHRGHLAEWAASMGSAEIKAPVIKPDVVVLDIGLPDVKDAQEALDRARALPGNPRVVILTAKDAADLPPLRASSVIIKPAEPDAIVAELESVVQRGAS